MTYIDRFMLEIPYPTPSLNVVRKMDPHAYKRLRDELTLWIRTHVHANQICPPAGRRRIHIKRFGARTLDYDNLVGGCKPLVDALRDALVIIDDSPKFAEFSYDQTTVCKRETRTVITVSDLPQIPAT